MGTSMTIEEMEAAEKAAKAAEAPPPPTPEQTAAADRIKKLEDSLRLSETQRIEAIAQAAARGVAPPPAPAPTPVPEGPKDLTAAELEELVRTDPTKALMLGMEQTRRHVTREVSERLKPMADAGYQTAETMARTKYADDFATIGPEIQKFIETIPEDQRRVALGNAGGWETMINYVRGQNLDKIVSARLDKAIEAKLGAARGEQLAGTVVPNISSGAAAPAAAPSSGGIVWDATTIEIMKNVLDCEDTPAARAEWVKWSNAKAGV